MKQVFVTSPERGAADSWPRVSCLALLRGRTVSDASEAKHNALLELTTGLGRSVEVAVRPLDQRGPRNAPVRAPREHVQRGERAIVTLVEDRASAPSASTATAV